MRSTTIPPIAFFAGVESFDSRERERTSDRVGRSGGPGGSHRRFCRPSPRQSAAAAAVDSRSSELPSIAMRKPTARRGFAVSLSSIQRRTRDSSRSSSGEIDKSVWPSNGSTSHQARPPCSIIESHLVVQAPKGPSTHRILLSARSTPRDPRTASRWPARTAPSLRSTGRLADPRRCLARYSEARTRRRSRPVHNRCREVGGTGRPAPRVGQPTRARRDS
jgi:hypothetical protein